MVLTKTNDKGLWNLPSQTLVSIHPLAVLITKIWGNEGQETFWPGHRGSPIKAKKNLDGQAFTDLCTTSIRHLTYMP